MHSPHPDIKIGETYNLRIHVVGKSEDFIIARPITQNGGYATSSFLEILHKYAPSFTPIHSEHGTSVPTTSRLFKKGDKVRIKREINGRVIYHSFAYFEYDTVYTVKEDEVQKSYKSGLVTITDGAGNLCNISFYELELVTPVEEIPTYRVGDFATNGEICVWRNQGGKTKKVCAFNVNTHPNAKAAAEAECARLNAEWRKEQNNG